MTCGSRGLCRPTWCETQRRPEAYNGRPRRAGLRRRQGRPQETEQCQKRCSDHKLQHDAASFHPIHDHSANGVQDHAPTQQVRSSCACVQLAESKPELEDIPKYDQPQPGESWTWFHTYGARWMKGCQIEPHRTFNAIYLSEVVTVLI